MPEIDAGTDLRQFAEEYGLDALRHALAVKAAREFGRLVAVCLPPGALELVEREGYWIARRAFEGLREGGWTMDSAERPSPDPPRSMLCVRCRAALAVPPGGEGRRVKCPKCGHKQLASDPEGKN